MLSVTDQIHYLCCWAVGSMSIRGCLSSVALWGVDVSYKFLKFDSIIKATLGKSQIYHSH